MNIEQDFLGVLSRLNDPESTTKIADDKITAVMDLTLLEKNPSQAVIVKLQSQLNTYPLAAVCVYPEILPKIIVPAAIKKATVVNFPEGLQSDQAVFQTISTLIQQAEVDEIDYVFPQEHLEEDNTKALAQCKQAYELCKNAKVTFKVILETGKIKDINRVYTLSRKLCEQGCDFLKTSTGKCPVGATPLAAYAMLKAIQDSRLSCGLKVSGGISLPQQACLYIHLAENTLEKPVHPSWFRIGASGLLDKLQFTC